MSYEHFNAYYKCFKPVLNTVHDRRNKKHIKIELKYSKNSFTTAISN